MTVQQDVVLMEKRGPVAIITLNRPEKINALNGEVYEKLHKAVKEYVKDDQLRCAIITGAGGNFSAGGDLKWFAEMREKNGQDWDFDFPAYKELERCPKPVIAAVDGYCVASGLNLSVLFCDFRIASDRAKFHIPIVKRPLRSPYPLPYTWHMSLGNAMYMFMTGKMVTAEEALRMGLVSEVVPHEQLMDRALELANIISEGSPAHMSAHKQYLRSVAEFPSMGQRLIELFMAPLRYLKKE